MQDAGYRGLDDGDCLAHTQIACLTRNHVDWQSSIYRVSHTTLATYVFAISRLPGHLELKSWKFSWSPFNSKFKTVLILIPIIKIDQISSLRRKKRKLKTNIFLNKNSSLEYVIKSLYGSGMVPSGF